MFHVELNIVPSYTRVQLVLMAYDMVNKLNMEVQVFISFVEIADSLGYTYRFMSFTLLAVRRWT
jgi:hypothetical protein